MEPTALEPEGEKLVLRVTELEAPQNALLEGATVTPYLKHISFKPFQICGSIFVHYSRPINI